MSYGAGSLGIVFLKDAASTLVQNLSKILIDFVDRAIVAKYFNPSFVSLYNISFDLSAKTNIPSQLVCAYYYPKLCSNKSLISGFLLKGGVLSFFIFLISILFYFKGEKILVMYGGEQFSGLYPLFSAMLILFSLYTFAFYSQATLRALGAYKKLAKIFMFSSLLGGLSLYPLFTSFGVQGILVGVLILRTPGVIGYFYLKEYLGRYGFFIWGLIFLQVLFFFIVVIQEVKS